MNSTRHLAAVLGLVGLAPALAAQTVRGTVAGTDGAPIAGAIVVLLDDAGATRATVLGDEKGRFRVQAPGPGRYRLRVDRVAFASVESAPFDAAAGETIERALTLREATRRIADVVVASKARCVLRPDSASALLDVWEEARKALTTISLTEEARRYPMTLALTERIYEKDAVTLRDQKASTRAGVSNRPFVAPPAAKLAKVGYVERDGPYWTFYAPDAQVILSDEFLGTHCFRLREPEKKEQQPGRIGLAFAPVEKGKLTDIEGTLWLDRASGELALLEYRYTRMPGRMDHASTGGRLEFARLPTGSWIVRRWAIRMPVVGTEARTGATVNSNVTDRNQRFDEQLVTVLAGIKEDGGEVLSVELAPGVVWSSDAARLTGTLVDSTRGVPLADAAVYLAGTAYYALTQADGSFAFSDLPSGTYDLTFRHPRLDTLALVAPRTRVTLARGAAAAAALAVPSVATQLVAACGDTIPPARRTVIRGQVRAKAGGAPVPDVRLAIAGLQQREGIVTTAAGEGRTDAQGRFTLCDLPPMAPVTLRFSAEGVGTAERVATPVAGTLVAVPVTLPD